MVNLHIMKVELSSKLYVTYHLNLQACTRKNSRLETERLCRSTTGTLTGRSETMGEVMGTARTPTERGLETEGLCSVKDFTRNEQQMLTGMIVGPPNLEARLEVSRRLRIQRDFEGNKRDSGIKGFTQDIL